MLPGKNVEYRPSFKTKRKNKTRLYTVNSEGTRYACLHSETNRVNAADCTPLVFNPSEAASYKSFVETRILDVDDKDFHKKLLENGFDECSVYTWILKSADAEKPNLKSMSADTPVKLFVAKVFSPQEIGTTHFNLDKLHPKYSNTEMPVVGAGEFAALSPTELQFNLLSGTFMAKPLGKLSKNARELTEQKIITMFQKKMNEKEFASEYIKSKDLIEGKCFVTPKATMNTLRVFFKNNARKNTNTNNKTRRNKKRNH